MRTRVYRNQERLRHPARPPAQQFRRHPHRRARRARWWAITGFLGVSASRYEDQYGNPGEPGDLPQRVSPACLHRHETGAACEAERRASTSPSASSAACVPASAHSDYEHTEFEGDRNRHPLPERQHAKAAWKFTHKAWWSVVRRGSACKHGDSHLRSDRRRSRSCRATQYARLWPVRAPNSASAGSISSSTWARAPTSIERRSGRRHRRAHVLAVEPVGWPALLALHRCLASERQPRSCRTRTGRRGTVRQRTACRRRPRIRDRRRRTSTRKRATQAGDRHAVPRCPTSWRRRLAAYDNPLRRFHLSRRHRRLTSILEAKACRSGSGSQADATLPRLRRRSHLPRLRQRQRTPATLRLYGDTVRGTLDDWRQPAAHRAFAHRRGVALGIGKHWRASLGARALPETGQDRRRRNADGRLHPGRRARGLPLRPRATPAWELFLDGSNLTDQRSTRAHLVPQGQRGAARTRLRLRRAHVLLIPGPEMGRRRGGSWAS